MKWNLKTLTLKAHWLLSLQHQLKISWLQVTDNWPNSGLNCKDIYCSLTQLKELGIQAQGPKFCHFIQSLSWNWPLLFVFISCLDGSWQRSEAGNSRRMGDNQPFDSSVSYQKSTTMQNLSWEPCAELFICKWPEPCHMAASSCKEKGSAWKNGMGQVMN